MGKQFKVSAFFNFNIQVWALHQQSRGPLRSGVGVVS